MSENERNQILAAIEKLSVKTETLDKISTSVNDLSKGLAVHTEQIYHMNQRIIENQSQLSLLAEKQDSRMEKAETLLLQHAKSHSEASVKLKLIITGLILLATAGTAQFVKMAFDHKTELAKYNQNSESTSFKKKMNANLPLNLD